MCGNRNRSKQGWRPEVRAGSTSPARRPCPRPGWTAASSTRARSVSGHEVHEPAEGPGPLVHGHQTASGAHQPHDQCPCRSRPACTGNPLGVGKRVDPRHALGEPGAPGRVRRAVGGTSTLFTSSGVCVQHVPRPADVVVLEQRHAVRWMTSHARRLRRSSSPRGAGRRPGSGSHALRPDGVHPEHRQAPRGP